MTSQQLEALYQLVSAMKDEATATAKTAGTREAFGVAGALEAALYDIHAAFAYLAIGESETKAESEWWKHDPNYDSMGRYIGPTTAFPKGRGPGS